MKSFHMSLIRVKESLVTYMTYFLPTQGLKTGRWKMTFFGLK